jgi:VRR-NUC domain
MKQKIPTESEEQKALIVWWSFVHATFSVPETVLMACPAQAARSIRGGARVKAEGYRAGTPDLFLAVARGDQHGLFIEMKRRDGGSLAESQKLMLSDLSPQGYAVAVCHGALAAKETILKYLTP